MTRLAFLGMMIMNKEGSRKKEVIKKCIKREDIKLKVPKNVPIDYS